MKMPTSLQETAPFTSLV